MDSMTAVADETSYRSRWPLVGAMVMLACLYGGSPNFRSQSAPRPSPYAGDFLQEWVGGYVVRYGDYSRFYDAKYAYEIQHDPQLVGFAWDRNRYLPLVYPPFYYVGMVPFTYLPYWLSAWIWSAVMVGCAIASYLLVLPWDRLPACHESYSTARLSPPSAEQITRRLPYLALAATVYTPLLHNLAGCQKGTVGLLLFTATFVLTEQRRPFTAGLVCGLLAFKPQWLLVTAVAMLGMRQWKFLGGVALTVLGFATICLGLGVDVCTQYVQFARGTADYVMTRGYDLSESHCLYGFFCLLWPGKPIEWIRAATIGASLLTMIWLAALLRAPSPTFAGKNPTMGGLRFSGLIIATILLSPHLYTYDLTLLLFPMGWLILSLPPSKQAQGIGYTIGALFITSAVSRPIAQLIHLQLTTVLLMLLLWQLRRYADQLQNEHDRATDSLGASAVLSGWGGGPAASLAGR